MIKVFFSIILIFLIQTGNVFSNTNIFDVDNIELDNLKDQNREKLLDTSIRKGFIQLMSLLPKSYPGHNIITEDIGEIIENDCDLCKNKKKFLVHGRAEKSEFRGCSDV